MSSRSTGVFALITVAAVAVAAPLALLVRSFGLNLRGVASDAAELEGQLLWTLGSAFVLIVAAFAAQTFLRDTDGGWRGDAVGVAAVVGLGLALAAFAGVEGDFILLAGLHCSGIALFVAAWASARRQWGRLVFSLPGAILVGLANWAAVFLE